VELEEPSAKLTPFPFKEQLSTDDLIAIMNGKGYQDVNAEQGMLFAGGAGGKIFRSQWGQQDVSDNSEIRAAQRASKINLDSATSGSLFGSDGDDEYEDITAERHKEAVAARHAEEATTWSHSHAVSEMQKQHASKTQSLPPLHAALPQAKAKEKSSRLDDGFMRHKESIDDALARMAKIRAQHDALESAEAIKKDKIAESSIRSAKALKDTKAAETSGNLAIQQGMAWDKARVRADEVTLHEQSVRFLKCSNLVRKFMHRPQTYISSPVIDWLSYC
jgi:hypothetical protein